ncbi:Cyclolysin secretion/processing ATP-binding protein CyaB [Seminavis robusta]|uniref:Cyclolysin secretion/processing ATP-binding protein CyaB n=1 Tax=Seminavis robusta TaxID=568900 RepID=A0A9N8HIR6_9STRA|nr:Cyclolysin secretion/processing ATP-binding protein CyaB [Seminavis robusta]|eukprot:Sro612_g175400.1 Cyclolysin secretion/processing ATP-binding protein CyaB (672) ;mRNA; f:5466-7481
MSPTTSNAKSSSSSSSQGSSHDSNDDDDTHRLRDWLWDELRPEWPTLMIGCLAMMVSSASNTLLPKFMGRLLDQNKTSHAQSQSQPSYWSLCLVVLGGGTASFLRTCLLNRAEESVAARIRSKVFAALLTKKTVEWFQQGTSTSTTKEAQQQQQSAPPTSPTSSSDSSSHSSNNSNSNSMTMTPGVVGTILNDDVTFVAHTLTATTANLLRSTISCVLSTFQMLRLNPHLFSVSVATVPLIGAAAMTLRKFLKRLSQHKSKLAQEAAAFSEERIAQIALVQMSRRQEYEIAIYTRLQMDILEMARTEALANGAFMGFTFSATSSALFLVVHLGGRAVAQHKMTSGQLTSFATYSFLLGLAASGIVKSLGEVYQTTVGPAVRVHDLLLGHHNDTDDNDDNEDHTTTPVKDVDVTAVEAISLRNVTFSYTSRPDVTVLRNVSMELKRGSVVALVGKNGSGKTTVASLLAGLLHTPELGNITLLPDGTNFFDAASRNANNNNNNNKLVQMVPQGAPLLNVSIRDNILYSNPQATEQQLERALTAANCHGFLKTLPGGLDYKVGVQGCQLSGGQRQRVALARALIGDPMLLILDEAGSALDHEGETALTDAVMACNNKTTEKALLLITHRAQSLQVADVVVVLRDGQVVETGSLAELQKKPTSALCSLMPDLLKL